MSISISISIPLSLSLLLSLALYLSISVSLSLSQPVRHQYMHTSKGIMIYYRIRRLQLNYTPATTAATSTYT